MKLAGLKEKYFSQESILFTLLAFSIFMPYRAAIVFQVAVTVFAFTKPSNIKKTFSYRASYLVLPFAVSALSSAAYHQNWRGFAYNTATVVYMLMLQLLRATATRKVLERTLDLCCVLSIVSVGYGIVEYMLLRFNVYSTSRGMRCESFFYNPNFFGSLMAMMMLICVYKILTLPGFDLLHYITLIACFIGVELSGSMFALVECAIGVFLLLLFARKYRVLYLFLAVLVLGIITLVLFPTVMPRLAEIRETFFRRLAIWDVMVEIIKQNPLFGSGALSYRHFAVSFGASPIGSHSHNIILELVASSGIVGSICFLTYSYAAMRDFLRLKPRGRSRTLASLPIAMLGGILVHGMVDLTIMWVQPATLLIIVLSAFGALEKMPTINKFKRKKEKTEV